MELDDFVFVQFWNDIEHTSWIKSLIIVFSESLDLMRRHDPDVTYSDVNIELISFIELSDVISSEFFYSC